MSSNTSLRFHFSGGTLRRIMSLLLLIALSLSPIKLWVGAFSPQGGHPVLRPSFLAAHARRATVLCAKKKKNSPAAAALEALEVLEVTEDPDQPLSKKELLKLQKQQQKPQNAPSLVTTPPTSTVGHGDQKLSKKEQMLAKALAMESLDDAKGSQPDAESRQLSKKELKLLKKKRSDSVVDAADNEVASNNNVNGVSLDSDVAKSDSSTEVDSEEVFDPTQPTLEDKIRKERPPPRIRVMESSQPGYTSLRLENVGIIFRNQQVLKDVTWGVQTGDRIGLVGANGAGKTTQLRILAGELEPTTGDVVKSSKDLRVAVLRQEFIEDLVLGRTLREEMVSVFEEENRILQEIKDAEEELATTSTDNPDRMQQLLDRMQELQNKAQDKDVYALESRVQKVMDLMGFTEDEGDDLVASFSGGWKMRIGLGKVLLKDPNVLLLDEPTNHLDLDSVEWLESFLREQKIPMVIVSHDREFLDQVCTKIVDAEGGICTEYDGNYSRFLQLKKARMDAWNAAYASQEKKIREERQWINQFRVKQPQAVKQREAKLEKLVKSKDYIQKPPFVGKPFRFRFPDAPRLSPEVAKVTSMSHAYRNEISQNRLFDDVDLFIEKGDRIAVVGPNGACRKCGKLRSV